MSSSASAFPAQAIAGPLCAAVRQHNAIVAAPPGAGKSTVLPLALLSCFPDKKILLMQPRRVVVRSLAGFLAAQLGEEVGQQVGYRIRGEQQVSSATRLEIITEGILSRRIQQDPELSGVDIIVFDEFHERSIHTDFGLALALEVQQGLREDLRLVVMSATLDTQAVAGLLPDAQLLASEGKMYPVAEVYCGQVTGHQLHQRICQIALQACSESQQDVLVFLPGAGGINKVARLLGERTRPDQVVHRLYGALDKAEQDAALQPDAQGRQKIILATNIAETSLTIANIGAVVDSGLENVAQFHPGTGLTQLTTQMISQASAAQRKGRAGRLGPGQSTGCGQKNSTNVWPDTAARKFCLKISPH
ncbi:DEAD/DEAH box helicase [Salinimonas marina]|uniref:DEAD/DEAH box helicase n=1 Tax=Salinimonas marina TaxID=2785918 RepID=A0A7S9DX58_9ALTE|nr:DEAD/DEAH box helicase [Salinimonas marina]QPG05462.1 DEAD/DEAH box helicase [Salinimonas marina]